MKAHGKIPRVLFFANIPDLSQERSIGGATVLAKNILDFLTSNNEIIIVHKQIRFFWKHKLQLIDYFIWVFRFPFLIYNIDVVSFHGTKDFNFTIAPILWIWAKLFRKKIVYHFFGGNFHDQYDALSPIPKKILKNTILSSDTVFFETKQMMTYFEKTGVKNAQWLPNARKPSSIEINEKKFERKFVFISRIIPQKGINEILDAAISLPRNYQIDIYGPIDDRLYKNDIFENSNVNYKGILQPDEIEKTLRKYDVLLLPSYFEGEGYPGIVIEGLSLGIPVIATDWKALPEIVTHHYNGVLIPIKNPTLLKEAILSFNEENHKIYRLNACKSFEDFNSDLVFDKLIKSYIN